jgi:hypothetical protein
VDGCTVSNDMRAIRTAVALALLAGACTQSSSRSDGPSPVPTQLPSTSVPASVEPTGATLADGTPLPEGCTGAPAPSETVAFVAQDRAWALDPTTAQLDCVFAVDDPGPFAWGPQGDRVLLGGLEVRGLGGDAPDLPPIESAWSAFDWGHPIGLAVVYAHGGEPQKRFMDDGHVEPLRGLPAGEYLDIAYHPSGLALAFVLEEHGEQSIWISTNEGKDPKRLVFSERDTLFTSIAFSPDGQRLWWVAEHRQGYPELHWMDLADRSGFADGWRGHVGLYADHLLLAPTGNRKSVNEGASCERRRALLVSGGSAKPVLPHESRPNNAVGWLDGTTLLVAVGGCGDATDLYSVDVRGERDPAALAHDVDLGAVRTQLENAPQDVPVPPQAEEEAPPGGLG